MLAAMSILYEDSYLVCDDTALTIKEYYFPFGSRRIPYAQIRRVQELPLKPLEGKFRIWGMGLSPHWYHLDWKRPGKKRAIALDLGEWIQPVLTPESHDSVLSLLREASRR